MNHNINSVKKNGKKKNLPKKKIIISFICCVCLIVIFVTFLIINISSNAKKEVAEKRNSTVKEFDSDTIINDIKIKDTSLANLNSLNDFLTKINAEVIYVYACTKKGKCSPYLLDDFNVNKAVKDKVHDVTFWLYVNDENNNPMYIDFFTYLDAYKSNGKKVNYYQLNVTNPSTLVSFDNILYKDLTKDNITSKYKLSKDSTDFSYKINFRSKDNDKYIYTFDDSSTSFQINNKTEEEFYK